MKLAYYPGCVSRSTGKDMDASTRAVCKALGIELVGAGRLELLRSDSCLQ